jgi:hypothetical protein
MVRTPHRPRGSATATDSCLSFRSDQLDKDGEFKMEDAAGFFANVFGGERFQDYVSWLAHALPTPPTAHPH